MQFPSSYFEDEVRDGFYVPSMMKHAWAAQLEVLEEIAKICRKHHITYFADCGTLLGAVRHGGFIPWDDDMDISMKRDDYNRFLAVAKKELPKDYWLIDVYTEDECDELFARVANSKVIRFEREFLEKFHGFPIISGIDIFPMDYLPTNKDEEELWKSMIASATSCASVLKYNTVPREEVDAEVRVLEKMCKVKLDKKRPLGNELNRLAVTLSSIYKEKDAKEITMIPVWLEHSNYRVSKEYYKDTVMLPFETTEIPVPAEYDAILRFRYGENYMTPVRQWDGHEYPFYQKQLNTVREKSDMLPPQYTFAMEDLQRETYTAEKSLKKQMQEVVDMLVQQHQEIRIQIESKETENAMALLGECQEVAIQLGTVIEELKGEGFVTVTFLEEYCELLYQMHELLAQNQIVDCNTADEAFNQSLERIAHSIKEDIRERKKVVFLPYKASTWDALESVWREAEADPDCDAYVVPIPYYYRNLDRSFGEKCYESEQFPDYVPITRYDELNLKKMHPDMIFIQNPYDEYNEAVSVEPYFYAKYLKNYTDKLVYIPYFVTDEIPQGDERSIINMEHYVTMPGVVHADTVIVQSEEIRLRYIEVLTKWAGEDTKSIWEEKILGLGSPKMDAAQRKQKEDMDIPEAWKHIIQKPDGTWKKVVLYYTSVSMLSQYQEQALAKIQDVLRVFRENKEEIALLWRPQSLIEKTISARYPRIWEEYQHIVAQYVEEGWGIYDDTIEMEKAVALCDAYYGDASEVVQKCKENEKMVMLQTV